MERRQLINHPFIPTGADYDFQVTLNNMDKVMRYSKFSAIAAMIIVLLSSCGGDDNTRRQQSSVAHNVFTVHPESTGMASAVTLPATVEEGRIISVGFKTAGQIEKICVKEGDYVKTGQLIALLDSEDYALGVSALREKYENFKAETDRLTKLHTSGNLSDNDYEKAMSGFRQLGIQLKIEENRLSYCRLTSPASGIVTKVNFENSEMVDAGTPVIELMDNNNLEAIVDLPVRLYASRNDFTGFVGESTVNPDKTVSLSLLSLTPRADNTQLYRLRLGVPDNSGFTPGMNIKVRILSRANDDRGVTIPLSAVFENDGHRYVWVVNPNDSTITATEITTEGTGENGVVNVVSGITAKDLIIRTGVRHLVNGEKVNILQTESDTNPGNLL